MTHTELQAAVLELIRFSEKYFVYFGLKQEKHGLASGIPDLPALHQALDNLKQSPNENDYDYIIHVLANKDFRTPKGSNSLHTAIRGYPILVKHLIAAGADVNARDDIGNTPLRNAIIPRADEDLEWLDMNRVGIVKDLLQAGARIDDKPDESAISNIEIVIQHGFARIAHVMLSDPKNRPTQFKLEWFEQIMRFDDFRLLAELLLAGVSINHRCEMVPIISMAVLYQSKRCLHTLIDVGADIYALSGDGLTPMEYAVQFCSAEIQEIVARADREKKFVDSEHRDSVAPNARFTPGYSASRNNPAPENAPSEVSDEDKPLLCRIF